MAFTVITASANFTRPADTTSYTSGDLVANSTVAASVAAMQFNIARIAAGAFIIRRARLKKSTNTTTAATFRLHLYGADPALSSGISNGDNAAWLTKESTYIGSIDLDASGGNGRIFADPAAGVIATVAIGTEIAHQLAASTIVYGLLEARGSYGPGNAEVFTVTVECVQN